MRFELDEQTLARVTRPATHGVEPHDELARPLHQCFWPAAGLRDLFVRRGQRQPPVGVEVADDELRAKYETSTAGMDSMCRMGSPRYRRIRGRTGPIE
jgi:hypothetical protein